MRAVIKHVSVMILLAAFFPCAASSAPAGEPPAEIRIGKAPPPAPRPDPATLRAIERFMAARQSASIDRSRETAARRWLTGAAKVDAATLAGGPGQRLVAFDFNDSSVERLDGGRFRVSVYVLFADRQGRVAESRDELLTFTGGSGGFVCASLKKTSVMHWDSEEAMKSAARLQSRDALERADEFLKSWAQQQTRLGAYSIEGVYPAGSGRIMIPCLKFTAEPGKRGYDVVDSPIIMRRGPRGYQIEPPAN
ncbi:MAG TPA: hypothetical protein VGJ98_05545 [Candidatus Eisenbacteria bacterium]|jgi:hypothetical protein